MRTLYTGQGNRGGGWGWGGWWEGGIGGSWWKATLHGKILALNFTKDWRGVPEHSRRAAERRTFVSL